MSKLSSKCSVCHWIMNGLRDVGCSEQQYIKHYDENRFIKEDIKILWRWLNGKFKVQCVSRIEKL